MRAVRALRDLRRYTTPVIVNNQGGQVNVATDGSQQANMMRKVKKKKARLEVLNDFVIASLRS